MTNPRLLLLDEVSLGLAPIAVDAVYESLAALIASGTHVVLVEQDLRRATSVAGARRLHARGPDRARGRRGELTREQITEAYFGLDARRRGGPS